MTKTASVYIEVEEVFEDEVDEDTFASYDNVDDMAEFVELVWEKRFEQLEAMGFNGNIQNIDCYKVDD
jgi:hypothetical protein